MKFTLLSFLIIMMGCVHELPCLRPQPLQPFTVCPTLYLPVCGCNGKEYENSCKANEEVLEWNLGSCETRKD